MLNKEKLENRRGTVEGDQKKNGERLKLWEGGEEEEEEEVEKEEEIRKVKVKQRQIDYCYLCVYWVIVGISVFLLYHLTVGEINLSHMHSSTIR